MNREAWFGLTTRRDEVTTLMIASNTYFYSYFEEIYKVFAFFLGVKSLQNVWKSMSK